MNTDSIKSILGQFASIILAILVATGVLTTEQSGDLSGALTALFTSVSAAIPAVLLIINLALSVWRHWGQKKVPADAVALELPPAAAATVPKVGAVMDLGPLKGQAKVVG